MTLETLKRLRLVVPGVIVLLILKPLSSSAVSLDSFTGLLDVIDWALKGTAAVLFGTFYSLTRLRLVVLTRFQTKIDSNIRDQLLAPCLSDPVIANVADRLRRGRVLMNVFYWYVDHDESLRARSRRIYFNGLLWSSAADLAILSLLGALVYWGAVLLFDPRPRFIIVAGILAVVSWVSEYALLPVITAHHIELGNDQIGFLRQHYGNDLCRRIKDAIPHL